MAQLRREFGVVDDTTVGGSTLDTLRGGSPPIDPTVAPAIPDPATTWPVTNVSVDKGQTNLDRNDEVRGVRGRTAPQEFRAAPSFVVRGRLYMPILRKLIALVTGATPTVTGAAPAAVTRAYRPPDIGPAGLAAVHAGIVRDDLYEKVAGCQLSNLALNFPVDDHATFEATFVGLYRPPGGVTDTPPTPDFSAINPDWALVLRDAQLLLASGTTGIDGLAGFSFTIDNNFRDPDFWPMQNRYRVAAGGGDRERVLWFPAQRKLGFDRAITGTVNFVDVKTAQEAKADLLRAEQAVFEVQGAPLTTTPVSRQLFRATFGAAVLTGGGASDLVKDGDITSQYDFGAFLDSANHDALFELVEGS